MLGLPNMLFKIIMNYQSRQEHRPLMFAVYLIIFKLIGEKSLKKHLIFLVTGYIVVSEVPIHPLQIFLNAVGIPVFPSHIALMILLHGEALHISIM